MLSALTTAKEKAATARTRRLASAPRPSKEPWLERREHSCDFGAGLKRSSIRVSYYVEDHRTKRQKIYSWWPGEFKTLKWRQVAFWSVATEYLECGDLSPLFWCSRGNRVSGDLSPLWVIKKRHKYVEESSDD